MKRFWVFCIICIVTASLGLLTYKFMTLEASLTVNQTTFNVNIGETIPLEVNKTNFKATTLVSFESLNEDIVYYDQTTSEYKATALGGKAILRITSNINNFTPILLSVTVGNGSSISPFFIKDADELAKIGVEIEQSDGSKVVTRGLDKCYSLLSDISLSDMEWNPIGSLDNPFTGTLNCNGHTISGLKMTANEKNVAGLFAKLDTSAVISGHLYFTNVNINGAFTHAGSLAAVNNGLATLITVTSSTISSTIDSAFVGGINGYQEGKLERCSVENSSVSSAAFNTFVGGIAGAIKTNSSRAVIYRSYTDSVEVIGNYDVGGIVGYTNGGFIHECYSAYNSTSTKGSVSTTLTSGTDIRIGGIAGETVSEVDKSSSIIFDCYSTSNIISSSSIKKGRLAGYIVNGNEAYKNHLLGFYYVENTDLYGIGYIEGVGKIASRTQESDNYKYIFNNLTMSDSQVFLSYESYPEGSLSNKVTYYWTVGIVWTLHNDAYPTIDLDGEYEDYMSKDPAPKSASSITCVADFQRLRDDPNGNFQINSTTENNGVINFSSVTDWLSIGTESAPFIGSLTCALDASGKPIVKLVGLNITASNEGGDVAFDDAYKGLFGVLGSTARISNIYMENVNILRGQKVGAIAAENRGTITNCTISYTSGDAKITTNNTGNTNGESNIYVGGIAGYSTGTIANCSVKDCLITISNSAEKTTCNVGGIAGASTGLIESSKALNVSNTEKFIYVNQACKYNVGGIVGDNFGLVNKCISKLITKCSTDNNNSYVGGIAGINEGNGIIRLSYRDASIDGTNVGGVVGISYGTIDQCYSMGTYTGVHVGGIAYSVSNGVISNCYTGAYLMGSSSDSIKCGLSYSVALVDKSANTACIKNCFSYVSFDGADRNYFDTASSVRTDGTEDWAWGIQRSAGYLIDCIFDRSVGGNANRSNYKAFSSSWENWRDCATIISDYNRSGEYSYKHDTGMTTEEIMSGDGSNVFRTYHYDEKIWNLSGSDYPTLKNVPTL